MRTGHKGRINHVRPVLDEDTAPRIGVVTCPHLLVIFQCPIIHASTSRRTGLYQHIGIFGPDPFVYAIQPLNIFDPEMGLTVGRKEC
ncbi:hypothetical protein SDC9_157341 [bioreactor metagenome]|uniref:Uncharacterized protein n=1 Tax=bioreactor metagenome TaxID=1076179 RepID=A0A645F6P9_9ZZZZ